MTQQDKRGYDVTITVRVPGDTESEAASSAHNLLIRYGLESGSVRIEPFRLDEAEGKASLDFLFEQEPRASLDFMFEREEHDAV